MPDSYEENDDQRIHEAILKASEVDEQALLWIRMGALVFSILVLALVWVFMIGPKEFSPSSEMVVPATAILDKGILNSKDLKTVSQDLKFPIRAPDLRQLGGKLTTSSVTSFGGVKAAVMQFQYGKSVFLVYRFQHPSKLVKDMRKFRGKSTTYCVASGGAVSVVVWPDSASGFYALAAKATERDLLNLAEKMVLELSPKH